MSSPKFSRRDFVKTTAASASAMAIAGLATARVMGANDRINMGVIGVGGMGTGHVGSLVKRGHKDNVRVLAVCDVYRRRITRAQGICKGDGYMDYRKLLDRNDGKATQAVWHAMWGTKISPELEKRVVEASRKDDQGSGYSDVFYYALTVHQSKREPTITRLIELLASQDTVNVAGRVLWSWLLTIPRSATLAAVSWWLLRGIF